VTAGLLERIDALLPDDPVPAGAGKDAAGAAYWTTLEAPGMPDPETVLAALVTQIAALATSIQDQRVTLATVAGDVKSVLARQDGADKVRDDHEVRLREIEHRPVTDERDHEDRLRKIERMIWIAAGSALAGGGLIGTIAGKLLGG
jgi:hypothetical protein